MTAENASPLDVDRRPGVVTFVAIILFINALMSAVTGIAAYIARDSAEVQTSLGLEADQILWYMVAELVLAVIIALVGRGVLNGARWARIWVTIGMGARLVQASLFAIQGGQGNAGIIAAVLYALIPLLVLWAVWGHDKGEAWFHHTSR